MHNSLYYCLFILYIYRKDRMFEINFMSILNRNAGMIVFNVSLDFCGWYKTTMEFGYIMRMESHGIVVEGSLELYSQVKKQEIQNI